MSGYVAARGRLGEIKTKAWHVAVALTGLFILYLTADRVATMITRWPATIQEAVAPSHCEQFVAIAKAAYGESWRVRLDPRDTTCDREVRAAWESQRVTRAAPVVESRTIAAPQPVAPPVVEAAKDDTHCLNVISLAKARYGEAWRQMIDPACAR